MFLLKPDLRITSIDSTALRSSRFDSEAKSVENIKNEYRLRNLLYLESPIGEIIYKHRISIERLFSILKMRYGLENPRLYGFNKYNSHVICTLSLYLIEKSLDKDQGVTCNNFPWNKK